MLKGLTVRLQNHKCEIIRFEQRRYRGRHLIPVLIGTPSKMQEMRKW